MAHGKAIAKISKSFPRNGTKRLEIGFPHDYGLYDDAKLIPFPGDEVSSRVADTRNLKTFGGNSYSDLFTEPYSLVEGAPEPTHRGKVRAISNLNYVPLSLSEDDFSDLRKDSSFIDVVSPVNAQRGKVRAISNLSSVPLSLPEGEFSNQGKDSTFIDVVRPANVVFGASSYSEPEKYVQEDHPAANKQKTVFDQNYGKNKAVGTNTPNLGNTG